MSGSTSTSLFPSVVAGLEQFRDRITGEQGSYRVALLAPGQPSTIVDVATEILRVVRDVLVWLRDGIVGLSDRLVSIDALVAMVEVLGTLLSEVAEVLDPSSLPLPIPGLAAIQGEITSGLGELGGVLADAPVLDLLPNPETLADLEAVLQQLVGPVDEANPNADVLGELLTQLASLGSG